MAETPARDFDALWEAARSGDRDAQLAVGRHYLADGDFGRARRWLGKAGRAGRREALTELGRMAVQGLGIAADRAAARRYFREAGAAGDAQAVYEGALLDYRDDPERGCGLDGLAAAARAGYAPALRQLGILLLGPAPAPGLEALRHAAARGDRMASGALARCYADGLGTSADPGLADAWAAHAVSLGSYCRQRFAPTATPGAAPVPLPEPARTPTTSLPEPALPSPPLPEPVRPLADDGRIQVYDGILDALECEYLIEATAQRLLPSHTVHPESGAAVRNELRTSYGMSLHGSEEDFLIFSVKARLAARTPYPVSHAEPFALLRYEPGQEYRAHFDYIDPASGEAGEEIGRRGQREVTIFAYLTDVAAGGQTHFPRHELAITARRGRALMFRNTRADGRPDPDSLHASLPVERGEKWIATLWVRGREYAP